MKGVMGRKRLGSKRLLGMVLAILLALHTCAGITVYAAETGDNTNITSEDQLGKTDVIDESEKLSEDEKKVTDPVETELSDDKTTEDELSETESTDEVTEDPVEIDENEELNVEESDDVSEEVALVEENPEEVSETDDEESGFVVTFSEFEGGSYVAYDRQDISTAVVTENATSAIARDSDTGEVDTTGSGQVNFSVVVDDGYAFESIDIIEGTENYKNLKTISNEGNTYSYRITKITGDITVAVTVIKLDAEGEREKLVSDLQKALSSYPKYYMSYCTPETASVLSNVLDVINYLDLETATIEEIKEVISSLEEAVSGLVYKTAEVPQVYISTETGEGNSLTKSKGYINTDVVIANTDGSILSDSGQVKVRGNSTAYAEKKAYNIKFSSKQNVLGMGNAKKWCLLANCFDASMLRNKIAFTIAQEMNIPYTSDNSYVEVWMDGVFKGCFLLTEAVEAGETRIDINVKNGDFALELEKSRVEDGTTYITNANGLRFSFKEPEEPNEQQYNNVRDVLDRVTTAIDSGDYSQVQNAIDVEAFAKFFVLNEYMKNHDFNFSSVYFFYKDGKLYAGPVWDFDLSSGNGNEDKPQYKLYTDPIATKANWYPYLFRYSEFRELVVDTFDQYKGFLEGISAEGGFVDNTISTYGSVFARNFNEAGWDVSKRYSVNQMQPLDTYEANVEYLVTWLSNRVNWMDEYYHNLIPPYVWITSAELVEDHVKISWKEENVDGYRVYRKTTGSWAPVSAVITGDSYEDYSIKDATEYHYLVVSIKDGVRSTLEGDGYYVYVSERKLIPLVIEKQPESVKLDKLNTNVAFSVIASGKDLKYMWYYKNPGTDNFVKTNVVEPQYTRYIKAANEGLEVHCVITDAYGNSIVTETVTASRAADDEICIIKDTEDIEATAINKKYTFRIEAEGKDLKYSWYLKQINQDKFYKAGVYTNEYTRTATKNIDGMKVYCVITDGNGKKVVGRTATLSIYQPSIVITYPNGKEISAASGKKINFTINAVSNGTLSYKWYFRIPKEKGGDGIFHSTGRYTNTYTRTATKSIDGLEAYCVVTDSKGGIVNSEVITFKLK